MVVEAVDKDNDCAGRRVGFPCFGVEGYVPYFVGSFNFGRHFGEG